MMSNNNYSNVCFMDDIFESSHWSIVLWENDKHETEKDVSASLQVVKFVIPPFKSH